jgi:hypothetical protein
LPDWFSRDVNGRLRVKDWSRSGAFECSKSCGPIGCGTLAGILSRSIPLPATGETSTRSEVAAIGSVEGRGGAATGSATRTGVAAGFGVTRGFGVATRRATGSSGRAGFSTTAGFGGAFGISTLGASTFTSGSSPCAGVGGWVPPEVPSWARATDGSIPSSRHASSAAPAHLLRPDILRLQRPAHMTHPPPNPTDLVLKTLTCPQDEFRNSSIPA